MNDTDERICSIALTLCPGIGAINAKRLVDMAGSATAVFRQFHELPDIRPEALRALSAALKQPEVFRRARQEVDFAEKHGLACLTLQDEAYPSRLRQCPDAPLVLFFKGNANLNSLHMVSLVGTRRSTAYGQQFCRDFLHEAAQLCPALLVVSGLAYGIDIHAHRAALDEGLPTVGVLAHGMDRIYPASHRNTAAQMLENGGLLTEFLSGTTPDRYNFISRNRIVAGITEATIVVESAQKGGALITAELANGYNRECFALPGRNSDEASAGCNRLIRDNKAALIESAEDFLNAMRWKKQDTPRKAEAIQRSLFYELSAEEQRIVDVLAKDGEMHINAIAVKTEFPINQLSALLFGLEMKGITKVRAGNMYILQG